MTIAVSPTRPSVRRAVSMPLHNAIKYLSDRVVLTAVFVALFSVNYAANLFNALTVATGLIQPHSRALTAAEFLGFVAIAVILKDLKSDRVLRWWDFVAIISITIASFYPSPLCRAIAMTCLGLLFVVRSDKRIASLGQLCIGLVWIDFWGALVLSLIGQWLLPLETAFAYLPLTVFGSFSLDGVTITNGSGWDIEVSEGCSAFHNTITTAFVWLSLIKIQRLDFHFKYFVILAIGLAFVVLLNTARIGIMAVSISEYDFWHVGPGLRIAQSVMLGAVLGLFYFGLRPPQSDTSGQTRVFGDVRFWG